MEIEIENYRGCEIRFNTDRETFVCDIDDERSVKKSFSAIKKFIDEFIKDNNVFKPFQIIGKPDSYRQSKGILKVIGIRKDGRLISEDKDGNKNQISDYDLKDYMLYKHNDDLLRYNLSVVEEEFEEYRESYVARKKEIVSKFDIVCLKEYAKELKEKTK